MKRQTQKYMRCLYPKVGVELCLSSVNEVQKREQITLD
jgi:hypothetical protein